MSAMLCFGVVGGVLDELAGAGTAVIDLVLVIAFPAATLPPSAPVPSEFPPRGPGPAEFPPRDPCPAEFPPRGSGPVEFPPRPPGDAEFPPLAPATPSLRLPSWLLLPPKDAVASDGEAKVLIRSNVVDIVRLRLITSQHVLYEV